VLLQCPGVTDAALIGAPKDDADAALELVAVLESEDGVPPEPRELRQFCELRLAKHLRPARFVWRAIPKTATGKVRKDVLLQQVSRGAP
jgi:fatty-acyl-CoA synthase